MYLYDIKNDNLEIKFNRIEKKYVAYMYTHTHKDTYADRE